MVQSNPFDDKFGLETFYVSSNGIQIKKRCPECGMKALSCNLELGAYNCFHCGFSGFLNSKSFKLELQPKYDLNKQKVILNILSKSGLSSTHRNYLYKRGVYNPDKFLIFSCPCRPYELLKKSGLSDPDLLDSGLFWRSETGQIKPIRCIQDRIFIPYIRNGKVVTGKSRSLDIDTNDKFKYLCVPGPSIGKEVFDCTRYGYKDLLITEGELKAIVCWEFGYSCCSFPGMNPSKVAINRLLSIIKELKPERIFIIFDTDTNFETRLPAFKQTLNLSRLIKDNVCVNFLPTRNNVKVDLDSFLLKNDISEFNYFLDYSWTNKDKLLDHWNILYMKNLEALHGKK